MLNRRFLLSHPAHFIAGMRCNFRLATCVNGVIVSTVGEYHALGDESTPAMEIGAGRLYETMVFRAKVADACPVCPYQIANGSEIDFEPYNDPVSA